MVYATQLILGGFSLFYTYKLLKTHNKECKLILTVSPIPLHATFRTDLDVVSASHYSKSVLSASARRLVDMYEDIYYFPSYEYIVYGYQRIGGPWKPNDSRHVTPLVIKTMMKFFFKQFGK